MSNESYVRVAVDGAGKYIRNLGLYVPIDLQDGVGPTTTLVQQQIVGISDRYGKVVDVDVDTQLERLIEGQRQMVELLEMMTGQGLTGGSPEPQRVYAWAGLPAMRGESSNPVPLTGDRYGRQFVLPQGPRELVGAQTTTISASTSETTIITAGTGFNDVYLLIISNTSASTSTRIDFRDATAGTILFSLQSVGGGAPIGFAVPVPIPQTTAGQNWTATCATSTTDVRIYAAYIKNR